MAYYLKICERFENYEDVVCCCVEAAWVQESLKIIPGQHNSVKSLVLSSTIFKIFQKYFLECDILEPQYIGYDLPRNTRIVSLCFIFIPSPVNVGITRNTTSRNPVVTNGDAVESQRAKMSAEHCAWPEPLEISSEVLSCSWQLMAALMACLLNEFSTDGCSVFPTEDWRLFKASEKYP